MAEERKHQVTHLDELGSSAIEKTESPIAQFISDIKSRIEIKLNSDKALLRLLSAVEDNSILFVEEPDLDIINKAALAEVGKRLSQDLKQKIGELNESVAALLTSSFQGIENYYNQLLPVITQYNTNLSHAISDEKPETTVSITNNNIKESEQSFFSVFKSEQHAQRDNLHNEEMVKQKLANRIPNHFQLGAATGQGDCFFDAMAQSLNALKGKKEYTVKSLRLLCDDYVKSGKYTWVKETIEQDKDNYEQYLVRIPFTVEELAEEETKKGGLKLEDIVWGRPEIEGRMICEITKVKLHVIGVLAEAIHGIDVVEQFVDAQALEPITTIEKGQYDTADIVYLVNYHNHFVPLFDNKLLQADNSLTPFAERSPIYSSPSNTNIPNNAPHSPHFFNVDPSMTRKALLEVRNKRTAVSIPSSLAKKEFADVIKEKIKQGANANSKYQSLLEKLADPHYQAHLEFLKEEMRRIRKETSNDDFQAYLTWLEKNYGKIDPRETSGKFEEEAIDLYIREEREVEIKSWNVPNIPPNFIGREYLLKQLAQRLNPKESQTPTVILTALHGLGGVGKTFLAARYAQLYAETYTFIFWFNAESETTLQTDYRNFADAFHLPIEGQSPENILTIIKNWLEQQSNWLIIYDNAPDDKLIAKFRPAKGGKILITSRKDAWLKKNSLSIDVFSLEEARGYIVELKSFALDEHQAAIDKLAGTLGYLPLALAQACAYIAANNLSLEDYLKLYDEMRVEMLADETMPPENTYKLTVAITWNITFEAIKKQQPAASALLESCAFLQGGGISNFLLKQLFAKQQPELAKQNKPFIDAKGYLQKYSMLKNINDAKKDKTFSMHNLVQEVIADALSNEKKQAYLLDVIQSLQEIFPMNEIEQVEDYAKQRSLLPHLEKGIQRIEEWVSQFKKEQSTKNPPVALVQTIEREIFVPFSVLSAHGYSNLGNAHKQKKLLEQVLSIQEQVYGKDHPEVAGILNNLANAEGSIGNINYKKQLLERILPIFEQYYGKVHPEVARVLVNLGNALTALNDAKTAKQLLERALLIKERHYGKDHPEVVPTLGSLANAVSALENKNQEDMKQAEEYSKRALLIAKESFGEDHPEFARALANLANLYGNAENFIEQKNLLEHVLPIFEKHYGEDHPEVARTLGNLANAMGDLNKNHDLEIAKSTKQLLERALTILEKYYGKDHPEVARNLYTLSSVYLQLKQWFEARSAVERAYQIFYSHSDAGLNHIDTRDAKEKLIRINIVLSIFKDLRNAANQNDVEKLKELIPKIDNVNSKDEGQHGRTALHWAVIKQAFPCIKLLLIAGADAMMVDKAGKSSLDYAGENFIPSALFLLLNQHYKLPLEDIDAGKLLRRAAHQNKVNDIKLLLKHINNINEKDPGSSQRTALHWAVIQGATDCIEALIAAGADPTIVDASGKTALDYDKGKTLILELLQGNQTMSNVQKK